MLLSTFNQLRWQLKRKLPKQTVKIMKLVSVFLFICFIHATATTNGQKVSLKFENSNITSVLKEIRHQTGYNIVAEQNLLNKIKNVSINVKNSAIETVLRALLKDENIEFEIQNKTISLKALKEPIAKPNKVRSLIDVSEIALMMLKGKVVNIETGEPISNATVYNNTSKKGTKTNESGSFEIAANLGDKLVISSVGFKPVIYSISITTDNNITISMELDEKNLEEYVATGYQRIKNSNMTGAISKVKSKDLLINGSNTIEQMLQGKLAGVEVVNNSGLLGTRQTVRVRGVSTILGNQEPVWVVDGIIQEDPLPFQAKELNRFNQEPSNSELLKNFIGSAISWLNPYDIEDVTVLKDAASTAIYGVKAANGVILINTKRGAPGRTPIVSYNTSLSTQSKLSYSKMNLMNSKERVDVSREIWERGLTSGQAFDNIGYTELLKQYLEGDIRYEEFNAGVKQLEINNTDWLDILMQRPLSQSHNLSISGGSENSRYYGSLGVNSQKGQAKGNGTNGYQGSINFTSNITPKLSVSFKIAGNYSKTDGFYRIDPYTYASQTSRVIPAYQEDGSLFYYKKESGGLYNYNIINELQQSGNSNYKTGLNSNFNVRYRLPKGFSIESILGINYANVNSEVYATEKSNYITPTRRYEFGAYRPLVLNTNNLHYLMVAY